MTVDEALAEITAAIDDRLAIFRRRFEDSLIANHAPTAQLEDLLDFYLERQQAWRARMLATVAAEMRNALRDYPSGWVADEARDPSEAF